METQPHYKTTIAHVIPEDWDVKRLGEIFSISAGQSKSAYVEAGGRYWVVDMGSVSIDGRLVVSKATNHAGDFLSVGDLVMPKDDIGGGGIIGKVGFIDADDIYVLGDHVYRLQPNLGDPLFLSYLINGYRTNTELRKKVIGSAQLGLGRKSVDEQEVPFPPFKEQVAIAEVLSDADVFVKSLERLLTKKREIKHGAMQELLTGRKRLPGLTNKAGYRRTEIGAVPMDWKVQSVHEFAAITTGPFGTLLKASEYSEGDGVPLISVGEIREGFVRITTHTPRVSEAVTKRLPQYVLRSGDIVFARKGGVERSALIQQPQEGWFLGSDGIRVRPSRDCHAEYVALQFRSTRVQGWLLQNAIGTTMPSLNQEILRNVAIPFPPTNAEQAAIAAVLRDMDAEIAAVEAKLAKAREIKRGMMQELLTGRIRLI